MKIWCRPTNIGIIAYTVTNREPVISFVERSLILDVFQFSNYDFSLLEDNMYILQNSM